MLGGSQVLYYCECTYIFWIPFSNYSHNCVLSDRLKFWVLNVWFCEQCMWLCLFVCMQWSNLLIASSRKVMAILKSRVQHFFSTCFSDKIMDQNRPFGKKIYPGFWAFWQVAKFYRPRQKKLDILYLCCIVAKNAGCPVVFGYLAPKQWPKNCIFGKFGLFFD